MNPPSLNSVKLNFDGSVIKGKRVTGFVLRNCSGQLIQVAAYPIGMSTVLRAEAVDLRNGVRMTVQLDIKNIIIEGDIKIIIDTFRGISSVPWQVQLLIQDVREYLKQFHEVQIQHVYREANRAADFLSRLGHTDNILLCNANDYNDLQCILYGDIFGRSLVRRGS